MKLLFKPWLYAAGIINGIDFIIYTGAEQYFSVSGKFHNTVERNSQLLRRKLDNYRKMGSINF